MAQVCPKLAIIEDHSALVTWALRRLHTPPHEIDDARQGGAVGLLVALARYDPQLGAFRSFAVGYVLEEVRRAVGWNRRAQVRLAALDESEVGWQTACEEQGFDYVERSDAIAATAAFVATLDLADQALVRRVYEDGATQTAVAEELGTSKMAISRRLARIHARARVTLASYAEAP